MKVPSRCFILLSPVLAVCFSSTNLAAQQRITVPRADGKSTPLVVYSAVGAGSGCAPLAIISHGAGASEYGYRYLAQAMAHLGYTTIVMGHRESGLAALRDDMREYGIMSGLTALVADKNAEAARLLDVSAALKWADSKCHAPFRALLGHSMGAETVMFEAGAENTISLSSPPAGQDRFDAYVALSPEGPGIVFPDDAWSGIRKPVLILTGTLDQSLKGGPEARLVPWTNLPGLASNCQWEGVIDGATHMNFAGVGMGSQKVDSLVTQTIAAFLRNVRRGPCTLPKAASGMKLKAK
jgi:predicted dienelactone hydrolase